jgi:hypothetical protein
MDVIGVVFVLVHSVMIESRVTEDGELARIL